MVKHTLKKKRSFAGSFGKNLLRSWHKEEKRGTPFLVIKMKGGKRRVYKKGGSA